MYEIGGVMYLHYHDLPKELCTLYSLFADTEKSQISESDLRIILKNLLKLMELFSGMLKHLDPKRVFINKLKLDEPFKILPGDNYLFSEFNLHQFELKNLISMSQNDPSELQFLTPEVVHKLMSKGLEGNEKRFKKLQDGQLWWDLGIIMYWLAC